MTKYELRIAGECKQNLKICKKPQPWGQILSSQEALIRK